mmetsp:Transcript_4987/g.4191  ORF Transcript_4987/g.4191 Transcript_4987/m.4191 type:complete len:235 (+) Transcript_4987:1015-1719(+)
MDFVLHQLNDEEGWFKEKISKSFVVKYKKNGSDACYLRMEGVVDVPLFNILTLIYEVDGHPEWIPFCSKGERIKKLHRAAFAIKTKYSFPPPLAARECYMYGRGYDRLDRNGSVLLVCKSYDKNVKFLERFGIKMPEKQKGVKVDIHFIGTEIVPLGENQIRLKISMCSNPHISFLPMSILNWFNRKFASMILGRLVKKAKKLGPVWEEKVQYNREFYDWLEIKVANFLKKLDG